jgi:hypothetical protein
LPRGPARWTYGTKSNPKPALRDATRRPECRDPLCCRLLTRRDIILLCSRMSFATHPSARIYAAREEVEGSLRTTRRTADEKALERRTVHIRRC